MGMEIGGIQRFSSIDFPGKLATVIFTVGCNFRCPFCHNPELVEGNVEKVPEETVWEFLSVRREQLEGVVISGGEPTLQRDLPDFIEKIKALGFAVKLDTNGTNPRILKILLSRGILDFVAMDIKHIWSRYADATGSHSLKIENIKHSVDLLLNGDVNYEFRTTVIRDFHDLEDIVALSEQIRGAKRYVVQEFIPKKTLDVSFARKLPFEKSSLETLIPKIEKNVQQFEIRQ
ncbi:MAG: anaerobic ribonucleoside-triphosphate reductase activating protein [Puniceicoccales bacterium]|jgi:pyruvate formate lyase activating enzyme|nr:anaerobic ribonucleoside-triphosphate reductase activating protein [Puniceicoccales bacterium]